MADTDVHTPSSSGPPPRRLLERLGANSALDVPARGIHGVVQRLLGEGGPRSVLRGDPLGHTAHPALVLMPIGAWTSASLLDLGGRRTAGAAEALVTVGLAVAPPTLATGWSDWADTQARPGIRRIGLVHAGANVAAATLYAASLAARRRGRRGRGVALGFAGLTAVMTGGYIGGHLAYVEGSRAERSEPGAVTRT